MKKLKLLKKLLYLAIIGATSVGFLLSVLPLSLAIFIGYPIAFLIGYFYDELNRIIIL